MSIFSRLRAFLPSGAGVALSIAGGLVLVVSFPDFELGLTWAALAALLFAVDLSRDSVIRGFVTGWIFGTVFFTGSCWWLTFAPITYAHFPWPIAYLALLFATAAAGIFPGIFGALFAFVLKRRRGMAIVAAPFLWVFTETLRMLLTGNNWNAVGYAHAFGRLVGLAEFGGVYLVGFVVAAVAAALFWALTADFEVVEGNSRSAAAVVVLFVVFGWIILLNRSIRRIIARIDKGGGATPRVALAYCLLLIFGGVPIGVARLIMSHTDSTPPAIPAVARVVAIQPNVPMDGLSLKEYEALLKRHVELTENAIREQIGNDRGVPVTVVFPESPMMFQHGSDAELREFLTEFVSRNKVSLVINSAERAADGRQVMNSAVMIGPDGTKIAQYDKIYLLPFGEYIPFPEPLASMMPAFVGNFKAGTEFDLLPVGDARAGLMICFESHFGSLAREYTRRGGDILIEMTNDGYLGNTPVLRQHLANSVFRAVETGRPLARVTNVGITAMIDSRGRVLNPADVYREATAVWNVSVADRRETLYVKWGEWFAWLSALASVVAVGVAFAMPRRFSDDVC